jgi:cyclase
MKKIILALVATAYSLVASIYNLENHKISITKDVHCVIGDFNPPMKSNKGFVSNMCYIDIGDSIVVLDAGPTYIFAKEFTQLIKNDYPNKKIVTVVLSNYHDDRVQGASYYKDNGAVIIGGSAINDDIKNNPEKFTRYSRLFSKELLKGTKVINADILANDKYLIKGSNKTLEILKPSVSSEEKSDIFIYSKDDSFIFAGNIIFNGRMLNFTKNSDVDGWIQTLEKIKSLNAKYILGGHGKEYDRNSYKASLDYLKILKKDVKNAYENDTDAMDIQLSKSIYENINIPYFKQLNNNNINRYYEQLDFAE